MIYCNIRNIMSLNKTKEMVKLTISFVYSNRRNRSNGNLLRQMTTYKFRKQQNRSSFRHSPYKLSEQLNKQLQVKEI